MRLVTFASTVSPSTGLTAEKIGIHTGELGRGTIIDITVAALALSAELSDPVGPWLPPADMLALIRDAKTALPKLSQIEKAHAAGKVPASALLPEEKTQLLSPIPRPVSMRDGYAFRQHVEAARRNRGVPMIPEFDQFPIFYFTNHLAVTGPGDLPVQKLTLEKLDFELEAAIVLGKGGRNIPAAKADDHIFGYMIMNDWSARHLQMEEMKLNLGPAKGKDFATSLGPYLVTRDELRSSATDSPEGERHDLKMRCLVNGKQVSEGNLNSMTWTFAQIVERASYGVEMHVGEVIGSGTVGTGCFLELNGSKITDNQWLRPGDECVLEIDRLGRLVNTIRAAPATPLDETLPR